MDVDLVKQCTVFIICCVYNSENTLQDSHIRQHLFLYAGQVKHEGNIPDSVSLHIVMHHFHSVRVHLCIIDRRGLPCNILPPEHRDLCQILRRGLFFLIRLQFFRRAHQRIHFFR